jgi:serine/threonine-protein kinase HipA
MAIGADGFRMSQLAGCVERASTYLLGEREARELIDHQVEVIRREWADVAELARMSEVERAFLWRRQLLNPYAFEGYSAAPT